MYIKIQVYVGHLKFNQINNKFNIKRRLKWLLINLALTGTKAQTD